MKKDRHRTGRWAICGKYPPSVPCVAVRQRKDDREIHYRYQRSDELSSPCRKFANSHAFLLICGHEDVQVPVPPPVANS